MPPARHPRHSTGTGLFVLFLLCGCAEPEAPTVPNGTGGPDPHSFSRPQQVRVDHLDLDLTVDFDRRRIEGRAALSIDNPGGARELWLDVRDLAIGRVRLEPGMTETRYRLGDELPYLGQPLVVAIEPDTRRVHVDYVTGAEAVALQWLTPRQTSGGRQPFLSTQSESVYARSWIPCQDSPSVRVTYEATVRVPRGALALMTAENPTEISADGVYSFRMSQPIPVYLIALVAGDLAFRPLGPRTGVYAEPEVLDRAAWEFAGTERMLETAEQLCGPYRWGRYDMVVLPAGFPYGGMENPRLTFLTPTLLAGDRSLVATVAHELAHSWSGNLVTQATWNDIWLNEGLTVYLERRIMEALHGREYTEMLAVLELEALRRVIGREGADPDTHLRLDLAGRDPDEGFSDVAYEKGYRFLRLLEESLGRDAWDEFLRRYFDAFAFRSMDTDRFLALVREELIRSRPDADELERSLRMESWTDGPGLPANLPVAPSIALEQVERQLASWRSGAAPADLETAGWTTHHWLHFLRGLPERSSLARLAELDRAFGFTTGNSSILQAWLFATAGRGYAPADAALERFLLTVGRQSLIEPLYERLAETPEGLQRARAIFDRARPGYHPIVILAIEAILVEPA